MDAHTYNILEYEKVIEILSSYSSCELGRQTCEKLYASTDEKWINTRLAETTEMKRALNENKDIDLGGVRNIQMMVKHAKQGGDPLDGKNLLDIAKTLIAIQNNKDVLLRLDNRFPLLKGYGEKLIECPLLYKEIYKIIDDDGNVKDNASDELARLRKKIDTVKKQVRKTLNTMVNDPDILQYLQEDSISIRQGRYVLFVKSDFRSKIPGMVIDKSDSGATVFIEPKNITNLDNELAGYLADEKSEVLKILRTISAKVGESASDIISSLKTVSWLDLSYAKARFSEDYDMNEPIIKNRLHMDIKAARHPILEYVKKKQAIAEGKKIESVISNDIRLGNDFDILVITGPNTGGKTVMLKTVGLLCLMAQSGLHIPAKPGSQLQIFSGIHVDIGDEQSIEQNLSTFSSHISQIIRILHHAGSKALVLLDELGAGTDPAEGTALGLSILNELLRLKAKTLVTTHMNTLKGLAYTEDRVENGSFEFDMESLKPTYKLLIGQPGMSNAFNIAHRLGMPKRLIKLAESKLVKKKEKFSEIIEKMEESKRVAEENRRKTEVTLEKAQEVEEASEYKMIELERKTERLEWEFEQEIQLVLSRLKGAILGRMSELTHGSMSHEKKMEVLDKIIEAEMAVTSPGEKRKKFLRSLKIGQYVYVVNLRQVGLVSSVDKKRGKISVKVGGVTVDTRLSAISWPPQ